MLNSFCNINLMLRNTAVTDINFCLNSDLDLKIQDQSFLFYNVIINTMCKCISIRICAKYYAFCSAVKQSSSFKLAVIRHMCFVEIQPQTYSCPYAGM